MRAANELQGRGAAADYQDMSDVGALKLTLREGEAVRVGDVRVVYRRRRSGGIAVVIEAPRDQKITREDRDPGALRPSRRRPYTAS